MDLDYIGYSTSKGADDVSERLVLLTTDENQELILGKSVRFLYRNTDLGREICGLLMDEDIVPCRYEGLGNYYEPDHL